MKLSDTITVQFTEEDRQKAGSYVGAHCLLATALYRMGFQQFSVGGCGHVSFPNEKRLYESLTYTPVYSEDEEPWFHSGGVEDLNVFQPPFYFKSVVGKTLTLKQNQ